MFSLSSPSQWFSRGRGHVDDSNTELNKIQVIINFINVHRMTILVLPFGFVIQASGWSATRKQSYGTMMRARQRAYKRDLAITTAPEQTDSGAIYQFPEGNLSA